MLKPKHWNRTWKSMRHLGISKAKEKLDTPKDAPVPFLSFIYAKLLHFCSRAYCDVWVKKRFLATVFMTIFLGFFSQTAQTADSSMRLGLGVWAGYQPFYLAKDLGFFKEDSVKVISLPSNSEALRAFQNGALDAAGLTLDEALLLAESGVDVRVLLVVDFSEGADVVLGKPEFKTLQELKGKKIGLESTALGAYVLSRALELNGMTFSDIQPVTLEVAQHEEAFKKNQVDGVVTYEPAKTKLTAMGANVLFDSSQIPGEVVDVLVFRADYVKQNKIQISRFLDAWFKAVDYLRQKPEDASQKMSQRLKITPQEALASFEGIKLPSREENRNLFSGNPAPLTVTGEKLKKLMLDNKLLSKDVDVETILKSDFFKNG